MRTAAALLATLLLAHAKDPLLVHKDDACFVHALPCSPDIGDRVERVVDAGVALLHTVRATGAMTVLVPATGTVAINTRRISYRQTRILGVLADAERLYVLFVSVGTRDRPPERDAPVEGGRYELRVFWLADGRALRAPPLDGKGLPAGAPPGTTGKGPLRPVPGGVEVYGTRAKYEGRDLAP